MFESFGTLLIKHLLNSSLLTLTHGGGNILLRGCVVASGSVNTEREIVDSTKHQQILDANVPQLGKKLKLQRGRFL